MTEALQVAAVRLRLEDVPWRVVTAAEFKQDGKEWPLAFDHCLLFCRRVVDVNAESVVLSLDPGYVTPDGCHYGFPYSPGRARALRDAASALQLWNGWLASGTNP